MSVRWSIAQAADEFGVSRHKITSGLALVNAKAEDGTYSTAQICAAVFGDYQSEKTRLAKEQADKVAIDNAERRKELIRVDDALEIAQRFCHAIRQRFIATSLPDDEKNAVLMEIKRLESCDFTERPDDAENEG